MNIFKKYKMLVSIKEAFDNLPCGVAFFEKNGMPLLINKKMYTIVYELLETELQFLDDLDSLIKVPFVFQSDGKVWRFERIISKSEKAFIEIKATDVTEIYMHKLQLEEAIEEQKSIMRRMQRITQNIVSITRNEEILSTKMDIHNELGFVLSNSRQFISQGCPENEKHNYIDLQRKTVKMLFGEIGNNDEVDAFNELMNNANILGMEIEINGNIPDVFETRTLLAAVVRECLLNTVRHANGNKVFVRITYNNGECTAVITNNGNPPKEKIREGGGISSLRQKIENCGGYLAIRSLPVFSMTVSIPLFEEGAYEYDSCSDS